MLAWRRIGLHPQPNESSMSTTTIEHYHSVAIGLKGELFGSIQGPAFKETINELSESGKNNVVFDLSQTTLMDSSGIGVLIEVAEEMRTKAGDLRLAELEKRCAIFS